MDEKRLTPQKAGQNQLLKHQGHREGPENFQRELRTPKKEKKEVLFKTSK